MTGCRIGVGGHDCDCTHRYMHQSTIDQQQQLMVFLVRVVMVLVHFVVGLVNCEKRVITTNNK